MKSIWPLFIFLFFNINSWAQNYSCADSFHTVTSPSRVKDNYSVAFLLPLALDKSIQNKQLNKAVFNSTTRSAYNLYQGVMIALDSINKLESPGLQVYIIDTESDSVGLNHWLSTGQCRGIDFIVSAMSNADNARVVEAIRGINIPFLSLLPLSPIENPYDRYIQMQPTLPTHTTYLRYLIDTSYIDKNLIFVKSNNPSAINPLAQMGYSDTSSFINYEEDLQLDKVKSLLDSSKTNVIIASLLNKTLAEQFLTSISKITNYKLDIYGMPTWDRINIVPFLTENIKIFFTAGFNKQSTTKGARFIELYKQRYGAVPNASATKGFEGTLFFVYQFIKHPNDYFERFRLNEFAAPINNFIINPSCDIHQVLHHWQNTNVYLVRGEDGVLEID